MNWLKSIAAAALLQAVAITPSVAGENLDQIKSAGVIKIGTEGTYAPFTFHDGAGKLAGFDVEIGEAVANKLGVKAEFVEGKWDGLIAGIDANRYDAVINQVGITEARKQKYDFSDPYIASKAVLIVRSNDDEHQRLRRPQGQEVGTVADQQFRQAGRGSLAQSSSAPTALTSRSSWF